MELTYKLGLPFIGPNVWVDIETDTFENLKAAMETSQRFRRFEEIFETLLQNFVEYEQTLMCLAVEYLTFLQPQQIHDYKRTVSRRLVNLLASARMYTDQAPRNLGPELGGRELLKEHFREMQNGSFDLRFGRALRNFAQHNGLPFDSLFIPSAWEARGAEQFGAHRIGVTPTITLKWLLEQKDFDPSVSAEIKAKGLTEVSVSSQIRKYVESLGSIHVNLREQSQNYRNTSYDTLQSAFRFYSDHGGQADRHLMVSVLSGDNHVEQLDVHLEHHKMISELQGRVRSVVNLSKRFVSSEAKSEA